MGNGKNKYYIPDSYEDERYYVECIEDYGTLVPFAVFREDGAFLGRLSGSVISEEFTFNNGYTSKEDEIINFRWEPNNGQYYDPKMEYFLSDAVEKALKDSKLLSDTVIVVDGRLMYKENAKTIDENSKETSMRIISDCIKRVESSLMEGEVNYDRVGIPYSVMSGDNVYANCVIEKNGNNLSYEVSIFRDESYEFESDYDRMMFTSFECSKEEVISKLDKFFTELNIELGIGENIENETSKDDFDIAD